MRLQDTALGRAMPQFGITDGDEPVRVGYGLAPSRSKEGIDWFGDDGIFPQPDKFDALLALLGLTIGAGAGSVAYAGNDEARRQYQQLTKDYAKFLSQTKTAPVPSDVSEDLIKRVNSLYDPKNYTGQALLAESDDKWRDTAKKISTDLIKKNIIKQVEEAYNTQRTIPTKQNIDAYNKTLEKFGGKENFKFDVDGDFEDFQPRINKQLKNIITSTADKLATYTFQEASNKFNVQAAGQAAKEAEIIREGEKGGKNESKRLARLEKQPGPVSKVVGGTGRSIIRAVDMIKGIGGGGSRLLGK